MADAAGMETLPQKVSDPTRCPMCSELNDCPLGGASVSNSACWCASTGFPDELLAALPEAARNLACICRGCVESFNSRRSLREAKAVLADDYYFDATGLMVFSSAYLSRRGFCCENDCRHCPYQGATS